MYDIAVIGGGPAGISAAIFTAKSGRKTIVLDAGEGMTEKALLKNYFAVTDAAGPDMLDDGKDQLKSFGADFIDTEVTNVTKQGEGFKLTTSKRDYEAKVVIFATGFQPELAQKIGLNVKDATETILSKVISVNPEGKTNIDGIWAAGAVAGISPHAIISAGDGAKVAVNIISEAIGKRYYDHDAFAD